MNSRKAYIIYILNTIVFIALEAVSIVMVSRHSIIQRSEIMKSISAVSNAITGVTGSIRGYFSLGRVNNALAVENVDLRIENDRLRAALELATGTDTLTDASPVFDYIPATIVSNSTDRLHNILIINKGRLDGIEEDMGVITGRGIVGYILCAGDRYSKVSSILDTDNMASAILKSSNTFGVLQWKGGNPGGIMAAIAAAQEGKSSVILERTTCIGGLPAEGSTGMPDNAVQAYNYRLCLTNDPANRLLPERPRRYDRREYLSLVDDVYSGTYAGVGMLEVTPEMQAENRRHIEAGGTTQIPGDPWGIAKVTNMVELPNHKTDANNQHLALISTDLPEENWPWPEADWRWRDKFAQRLRDYTLGLLWFAQNDEALPAAFRQAAREWGLAKDEYADNGHFPRQVYVREGRRLHGLHRFTAGDALPVAEGQRPPVYANSITASHYALDSHAVRKREPGKIALDGFFSYPSAVYTVPYGVIVPQGVSNLLIPVPASATHVGFSTLRMEPCWMALGQAAGVAASLAIDHRTPVASVPVDDLQRRLVDAGATLMYYKDVPASHPRFALVQHMGLRGYLPGWEARLDAPLDPATAARWTELSGLRIDNPADKTRGDVLQAIYELTR